MLILSSRPARRSGFGSGKGVQPTSPARCRDRGRGPSSCAVESAPLRAGRRAEPYYGTADLPNFFRKPFGPGWALVGDAGCHKDPYLALGISDAFRDAEFLAEAVDDGSSGKRQMDEVFADYESRRNKATRPDYREDLQAARLEALPPEAAYLRAALRRRPEDATRFAMAQEGMIDREEFFRPENIGRIMAVAERAT